MKKIIFETQAMSFILFHQEDPKAMNSEFNVNEAVDSFQETVIGSQDCSFLSQKLKCVF